jgi:large subunit ribosomal protein L25
MDIPVTLTGTSPGVILGGKLTLKLRSVKIKALPANMPENITLDVSKLELGKSIKVSGIEAKDFEILNNPRVTVASVEIPRALKGVEAAAADEDEEEAETSSEATE